MIVEIWGTAVVLCLRGKFSTDAEASPPPGSTSFRLCVDL